MFVWQIGHSITYLLSPALNLLKLRPFWFVILFSEKDQYENLVCSYLVTKKQSVRPCCHVCRGPSNPFLLHKESVLRLWQHHRWLKLLHYSILHCRFTVIDVKLFLVSDELFGLIPSRYAPSFDHVFCAWTQTWCGAKARRLSPYVPQRERDRDKKRAYSRRMIGA